MDKPRSQLVLLATLLLSACSVPSWLSLGDEAAAELLGPGETTSLRFFTNDTNFDTGIRLLANVRYELRINLLNHWMDGTIDRNENDESLDQFGFADSLMPLPAASYLKRSRDHNWFELMLNQEGCKRASLTGISELNFDEASGSYNFVATCDGKLTLFVNDSYGFYGNNSGFASISLSRVN